MEKKMRLYDRFWDMLMPLSKEDIEIHNAEMQALKEYERLMRADAEKLELENREAAARVALIEEDNQRQRDLAKPYTTVARVEFALQMSLGRKKEGERIEVTAVISLEETHKGGPRRENLTILRRNAGSVISKLEYAEKPVWDFLRSRASYQLHIQPWLDGKLENADLKGAALLSGDCCRAVLFAGGKA